MLNRKLSNSVAFVFLGIMFFLMFFATIEDSATMDELAHIPSGYSYLAQRDYRLNPEHPPLMKDLAALPLQFMDLNFPTDIKAWREDINGQWDMGRAFLYDSGNDPDRIIFWARIPMMILALIYGWFLFVWIRKQYGDKVALFSLFFFSFSPTILAHSRYVTTDIAAALGFFLGIATFLDYLRNPTAKRLIIAGFALGIALLLKFSVVLLLPLYLFLALLWVFVSHYETKLPSFSYLKLSRHIFWHSLRMLGNLFLIGIIALVVIELVYALHISNYPAELQLRDTTHNLQTFGKRYLADSAIFMADRSVLRPVGQYLHGLLMVVQRASGGNTTYFLGDVSNRGWWYYFPVAYFLKETLAFHILTILAIVLALSFIAKSHEKSFDAAVGWMRDNFTLAASIIFIVFFWFMSIRSPLNIGVRHVIPTFPFIYLLVSRELMRWIGAHAFPDPQNIRELLYSICEATFKAVPKYIFIMLMGLWILASTIITFPHYLSYYNEFAGGTKEGYRFIVDSNYDWGQDLKRLVGFVEENRIKKIRIDYFGGGSPEYYLGDKYEPWWSERGKPRDGWFAISIGNLQGARGRPTKGFEIAPEKSYSWLEGKEPVARAGYSIFIYKF